jgi:hypothetical protein
MSTIIPARAPRRTTIIVAVSAALAVVVASIVFVTTVLAAASTPTPRITSGPKDPTNITSATLAFNDSAGGATFSCALDGSAFTSCSSPKPYPGPFANGTHTFKVRAQKTGSAVSSAESADWRVDTIAPTVSSITRADANPAKSGSLHWTTTFSEPVTALGASDFRLSTSGLGDHSPSVTDVAPIGSAPARAWTITVNASRTSAAHGTIGLDLGSNAAIRDAAGNRLHANLPIAGEVYNYDTVAPGVTLTKVNGSAVSFPLFTKLTVTSFAGACGRASGDSPSVSVSITGSATRSTVVSCTSAGVWSLSTTPALSGEGTYRVTATQSDTARNTGTSGERMVVVDRTPPSPPVFTRTPSAATDKAHARFEWRESERDLHFRCSLDGGAFTSCESSAGYHHLAAGTHCFAVVAIDATANVSAPATFCWTITLPSGLTISGNASQPLLPGAPPQALNLSISNPNSFAMKVTSLGVTIAPQMLNGTCSTSANFIAVHGLLVSVVIPAHSTRSLSDLGVTAANRPQIQMRETHVNQDACRGATVHLNYTAAAVQA